MKAEPKFEDALAELEGVVGKLEAADVPLETSLQLFEHGMHLSRFLEKKLDEAERKIEILVKGEDGKLSTAPFGGEPDPGGDDLTS